jgi:protein subunit release factor B
MQAPENDWEALEKRMAALGLFEADLEESFVLGSGKGGQKVNRTSNAVQVSHRPSGMVIKCVEERSQRMNRIRARERLCEEIEKRREQERRERAARLALARFQKRKPSARAKAKRVEGKRITGEVKRLRNRPATD